MGFRVNVKGPGLRGWKCSLMVMGLGIRILDFRVLECEIQGLGSMV